MFYLEVVVRCCRSILDPPPKFWIASITEFIPKGLFIGARSRISDINPNINCLQFTGSLLSARGVGLLVEKRVDINHHYLETNLNGRSKLFLVYR
ncbi:hypothetical protein TNIN_395781 [Trichonephila inaurata madagascariensis]|uniref:Uncharacterized protein n=1 Tax=Trichonephila inaurata madagascariensis TaxID=2747483 RepID=A0A8X6MLX5_9ARAC|nr:hypothetical protein TNIN_395781 [Trichonephila inaurata madagascariensis]